MILLFSYKGYNIWVDHDGFFGISKESDPAPNHCGYAYLHSMLKLKGI